VTDPAVAGAVIVALPLVACDPVQLPEAVHAVVLMELQVRVAVLPVVTDVGLNDKVGALGGRVAHAALA
jgi:hypothetical protein